MNEKTIHESSTPKAKSSTSFFVLLVLALVAGLMVNERFSSVESAVNWGKDLDAALAASKAQGKPVLISFTSDGCRYCVLMESEVIVQKEILTAIDDYIPVKLHANSNREAGVRYNVYALPAYVIVDETGHKLAMVDGFQPVEQFKQFLQNGLALCHICDLELPRIPDS